MRAVFFEGNPTNRFLQTISIRRNSDTAASRAPRRFKIDLLIANHPRPLFVDSKFSCCLQDQTRLRFPTITSFVRPMRAIVDTVNGDAKS